MIIFKTEIISIVAIRGGKIWKKMKEKNIKDQNLPSMKI